MRIWVPGLPAAQPRIKATAIGRHARVYTPPTANQWKAQVVHSWGACYPDTAPLAGAVSVALRFVMPRPKGHFGTGRNAGKLKQSAPRFHTSKPDIDNLGKAVLDALKGHAWRDDSQVIYFVNHKHYAVGSEKAGCHIQVEDEQNEVESHTRITDEQERTG